MITADACIHVHYHENWLEGRAESYIGAARDENTPPNGSWLTCIEYTRGTEKGAKRGPFRPLSGFWSCLDFRASLQPALRFGRRRVASWGKEVGRDRPKVFSGTTLARDEY